MAKVINLFGGPGTGKSTTAAGLFHLMKTSGERVELVTEFAKDLTYRESFKQLTDNGYVTMNQHHRIFQCKDSVDYIVTDSPIVQSLIYPVSHPYEQESWKNFILSIHNNYDSFNVFLKREEDAHPYQKYGRTQTLEQAMEMDNRILSLLQDNEIPFIQISVGRDAHEQAFTWLKRS